MGVFACYTPDGCIRNIMYCDEVDVYYSTNTGLEVVSADESVGLATHHILQGRVVERQPISVITSNVVLIANGEDEAIISSIPEGVQVEWPDDQIDTVTDGEIRFSVDLPGTYTFRFTAVPYLDKEVVIEAIPAT